MPIEYDIIERKKLVVARGSGVISGEEVITHLEAVSQDPRYVAPMKKLVDYRAVESMTITSEEAWVIAQKKKNLGEVFRGERIAFVSPRDLTFAMSREHQALLNGSPLDAEVFRSMEEALEWLEVTLDDPP